jgi:hypothetical protein
MDAVKFNEMGMATFDHIGSTAVGFDAGMAPASWPDAFRIQHPPDETTFPPSTVSKHAFTMVWFWRVSPMAFDVWMSRSCVVPELVGVPVKMREVPDDV